MDRDGRVGNREVWGRDNEPAGWQWQRVQGVMRPVGPHRVEETKEHWLLWWHISSLSFSSAQNIIKAYLLYLQWLCAMGSLVEMKEETGFVCSITTWDGTRDMEARR